MYLEDDFNLEEIEDEGLILAEQAAAEEFSSKKALESRIAARDASRARLRGFLLSKGVPTAAMDKICSADGIKDKPSAQKVDTPYHLTFGEYNGKMLNDIPIAYLRWLLDGGMDRDLTQKLAPRGHLSQDFLKRAFAYTTHAAPISHPVKSSANQNPEHLLRVLNNTHSVNKAECQNWTLEELYSDPYRSTYGKHAGKTLDEVPPANLVWLQKQGIAQDNHPFKTALDM